MERLTARNRGGQAYFKRCAKEPCESQRECWVCDFFNEDLAERLAAYEDLGVSPEQLHEVSKLYLEKCEEVNRLRAELKGVRHG